MIGTTNKNNTKPIEEIANEIKDISGFLTEPGKKVADTETVVLDIAMTCKTSEKLREIVEYGKQIKAKPYIERIVPVSSSLKKVFIKYYEI